MSLLTEGFPTTYTFSSFPSVQFYEKTVKPPGWDGGGANDTTTMRNGSLRTRQPKKLKTMTAMTSRVAMDSAAFNSVPSMINVLQQITVTFSDGHTWTFWGWLDKFEPADFVEGSQPEATVTIECANQNTSGVETLPTYA